tara:strand:- start:87 stop:293 length:207 start_codon:yes stop_codon:yes gene_type:complete
LPLSIFVFRAIALTFFVMLATLVMADIEFVLVVIAPMHIFATVVLGWHTVTQIAGSVGRVVPTMLLFS